MTAADLGRTVMQRLASKPKRTALAASGVGIGSATLLFLSTVTASVVQGVEDRLSDFGSRIITVASIVPGHGQSVPIVAADAALIQSLPLVAHAMAAAHFRTTVRLCGREHTVIVTPVDPERHAMSGQVALLGRLVSHSDVNRFRRVAVLSESLADVARCVVPHETEIRVVGWDFAVAGVARGGASDATEKIVYLPSPTLGRILGDRTRSPVAIRVDVRPDVSVELAAESIRQFVRRRHRLASTDPDDFEVRTSATATAAVVQLSDTVKTLLTAIVGWSMLIAGVAIANSVLGNVMERVSEIGLRRAVGATRRDIRLECLTEALILSVSGALVGLVVGILGAAALVISMHGTIAIDTGDIYMAIAGSVLLGALAGVWPAEYAASVSPAEAMRAE